MPLINCEITLHLKWQKEFISIAGAAAYQEPKFKITETKVSVPVVTLSAQDNVKLLKQLEFGFKRTINWNKYLSKTTNQARNRYLNFLIDPSFQGINRFFILSFRDDDSWESHKAILFFNCGNKRL